MKISFQVIIPLIVIFVFACKKRDKFDGDYYSSVDNAMALSEFSNIRNLVDVEVRGDSTVFKTTALGVFCPGSVITVTPSSSTEGLFEIDFGSGTVCNDSRSRSGKLLVYYTGKFRNTGGYLLVNAQGYTVNSLPLTFDEMQITNSGITAQNQPNWSIETTNATFVTREGNIKWDGVQTTTWIEGQATTNNFSDNVFSITGSGTGKTRYGLTFSWTITDPLIVQNNCAYVVGGMVEISPLGFDTRSLNFGGGKGYCDNFAVLTVGTLATQIEFP